MLTNKIWHPRKSTVEGGGAWGLLIKNIYAEVVAHVAGSLEAGGLPRYPESLFIEINVVKSWQSCFALYFTQLLKTRTCFILAREKISMSVQVEGWRE